MSDQQTYEAKIAEVPATVPVEDLDQFVRILTGWHMERCALVQHLLEVPEGSTFEVDGKEIVMTGATLDGFKLGIEMTMMQLGTLPFEAEMEDEPEATPAVTG